MQSWLKTFRRLGPTINSGLSIGALGALIVFVGALIQNIFKGETADFGMTIHNIGMLVMLFGVIALLLGLFVLRLQKPTIHSIVDEEGYLWVFPVGKSESLFASDRESLLKTIGAMKFRQKESIRTLHLANMLVDEELLEALAEFGRLFVIDFRACTLELDALGLLGDFRELKMVALGDSVPASKLKSLQSELPEVELKTGSQRFAIADLAKTKEILLRFRSSFADEEDWLPSVFASHEEAAENLRRFVGMASSEQHPNAISFWKT